MKPARVTDIPYVIYNMVNSNEEVYAKNRTYRIILLFT